MAKKDWELGHLQALKKEEEKRAAEEEDEILYSYTREEALQVKKNKSKSHRSRPNSRCSSKSSLVSQTKRKLIQEYQVRGLKRLSGTVAAIVALHLELVAEVVAVVVLEEIQGEVSFLMTFSFCLCNWKIFPKEIMVISRI